MGFFGRDDGEAKEKKYVRFAGFFKKTTRDGQEIYVGGRVKEEKVEELKAFIDEKGFENIEIVVLPNKNKLQESHPDYNMLVQEKRPKLDRPFNPVGKY